MCLGAGRCLIPPICSAALVQRVPPGTHTCRQRDEGLSDGRPAWRFEPDSLLLRTNEDVEEGPSQEKQGRDVLQC